MGLKFRVGVKTLTEFVEPSERAPARLYGRSEREEPRITQMDEQRLVEVVGQCHVNRRLFHLKLLPIDVMVLHAALRLTATHPEVAVNLHAYADRAKNIRDILLDFLLEMGFTEEEVAYLDSVDEAGLLKEE